MQKMVLTLLVGILATCGVSQSAFALKQFNDEFKKVYDVSKSKAEESKFAKAVLDAKCYLCHQGRKSKKNRNSYGAELAKLLDKKKDKSNKKKMAEAFAKVAKLPTDPKDKQSPTFGDLIKAGKLPGGPLADSKKEPSKGSGNKPGSDAKPGSDSKAGSDSK